MKNNHVFIIAEIGCNFEGSIRRAKEMVRAAAAAGADAVKFQTFIPEKLASKHAEKFWDIEGCPGDTQLDEFMQMPKLTFGEYRGIQSEAKKRGVVFFSTPSDEDSVDLLEKLNAPLYKVSSMDITHAPLLRYIARTKKPVILSTGASTIKEIKDAVKIIRSEGNRKISLLHCTSNYPVEDENVNLNMITHLRKAFPGVSVGYSDHALPRCGEGILAAAVALGARIIEKHFTFDNKRAGYDHAISADYKGLAGIVKNIRRVEKALGSGIKKPVASEMKARIQARRSIIAAVDIEKNSRIKGHMLEIKRPGYGIQPKSIGGVIGKTARIDIAKDDVIRRDMLI